jgi:hypothetical protein
LHYFFEYDLIHALIALDRRTSNRNMPCREGSHRRPPHTLGPLGIAAVLGYAPASPPCSGLRRVAAHTTRGVVAAGYADGLVTIAQIGRPDELLVQPDAAAIVAFPPKMLE